MARSGVWRRQGLVGQILERSRAMDWRFEMNERRDLASLHADVAMVQRKVHEGWNHVFCTSLSIFIRRSDKPD